MHIRHVRMAGVFLLTLSAQLLILQPATAEQTFRSDEWITECEVEAGSGAPDCSITLPFWQARGDEDGSFALVVMIQTGKMPAVSGEGGDPGRQKPANRVPTDALLYLPQRAIPYGRQAAQSRIAYPDRRVYGERSVQLQLDTKGVPGRDRENSSMGVPPLSGLAGPCPLPCIGITSSQLRDCFLTQSRTPG